MIMMRFFLSLLILVVFTGCASSTFGTGGTNQYKHNNSFKPKAKM